MCLVTQRVWCELYNRTRLFTSPDLRSICVHEIDNYNERDGSASVVQQFFISRLLLN
jgi:hypothetical protein